MEKQFELEFEFSRQLVGPVLFDYVWWILRTARKKNIHRIYFLARDGYLLLQIAEAFCRHFCLEIECRYLYCSRKSLRMPAYHLMGEEAYELLFLGGYCVTLSSLLKRVNLGAAQRTEIYTECGLSEFPEDRILNRKELETVCGLLRGSKTYRMYVDRQSRAAYQNTIGYLKQEGLLEQETVALVDSGWTGSMQRTLRQLLESAGFCGKLEGFYFGMYAKPKSFADGDYHTWYFSRIGPAKRRILFCNNLFECLLAAPHGMTTGYSVQDGRFCPQMLPPPEGTALERIQAWTGFVCQYTDERLEQTGFETLEEEAARKDAYRRIRRYMVYPTRAEAAYWGGLLFCDDITEAYQFALADPAQREIVKGYTIPARIRSRFQQRKKQRQPALFWPYGTIAFLPEWQQWWYRLHIYLWEWIRYVLY